jgi:hypothetical protein
LRDDVVKIICWWSFALLGFARHRVQSAAEKWNRVRAESNLIVRSEVSKVR